MKLKLILTSICLFAIVLITFAQSNENNNLAHYLDNCPFKMPGVAGPVFNLNSV